MARPRKILSAQTGNLTVGYQEQRAFEESLAVTTNEGLAKAPPELIDARAKKEWRRIVPILTASFEILGDLDKSTLIGYCNAYSRYIKATKQLAKEELVVEGKDGMKENPLIAVQLKYAAEMRNFAGKCGPTIDSRLKMASEKAKQIDNDLEGEFGGI